MTNVCAMILLNSKTRVLIVVFVSAVCAEMDSVETKSEAKKSFVSLLKNIVEINEKRVVAMKNINKLQDFMGTKNTLTKIHNFDLDFADSEEYSRGHHAVLTLIDERNNLNLTLRRTYDKKEKAANNNINIIIPFNSFNIKSELRNDENNKSGNRDDHNSKNNNNGNDRMTKNNNRNYKIRDSNTEQDKANESYKTESTNENDYGNDDVSMNSAKHDNNAININNEDDQKRMEDTDEDNVERDDTIDLSTRKNWRGACDRRAAKVCISACVNAHKNVCMLYKCSRRAKKTFGKECKKSCREKFLDRRYSDSE